jgi:DNA-binding CsgD family transcriptional regulator/tetratricopeptide (TPR) repeat protein
VAGWGAFVGRERELTRLQAALAGETRLVLVVGDAGIGKTRFVSEGLGQAAAGGMLTVGGGCLPLAEKLPLLPVADALEGLSRLDGGTPFAAALEAAPVYVRSEVARLLPQLGAAEPGPTGPAESWLHERLFAGVAALLGGVARKSPLGLLIEDVHWADGATLDFLTYVTRAGGAGPVTVVATCRGDEAPLDAAVADWLTNVHQNVEVEEIRLGPLSRAEITEQVMGLMETLPPAGLVEEVYARTEGHPFFTEQLVAAAVTDSGQLAQPVALPERLAELLVARAARCSGDARTVLNALAVAGRPLTEVMLAEVTGLGLDSVSAAARELTTARLLAAPANGGHRLRHALLGEAVAADLPPGERLWRHERIADALQATGDETLAAEAAGHWAAAGCTAEELRARLTAATAAEHMFAYAAAAAHWQRAIELYEAEPDTDLGEGIDPPRLYIRAVDSLEASGERVRAGAVAEEAYRRFADHADRATAAAIHFRAGSLRAIYSPAAGDPLMKEGLRLFEGTPPSPEQARAWLQYALDFLFVVEGRQPAEIRTALESALMAAEAAGAATVTAPLLCLLAEEWFTGGEVEEGFRLLAQARSVLGASKDAWAVLWLAIVESDALLKVCRLEEATNVGLRGFDDAQRLGFGSFGGASISLSNAIEGLLGRGSTRQAAALIDPLTTGPIDPHNWPVHEARAEIDLLRGEVDAAANRLAQIDVGASLEFAAGLAQDVTEVALWAGRPDEALETVQRALESAHETDWLMKSGWLLAMGMRACADLTEQGRARRDDSAVRAALAAADNLASWVSREHELPFTEHPFSAAIPATHAIWDAERSRVVGASDPAAWSVAAERWETLDYRHRAGYCWWRQGEAQLCTGETPASVAATVRTAAAAADGHVPLLAEIRALARRARIRLDTPLTTASPAPVAQVSTSYGLTERELDVLRLLTLGRSNTEIAAELFISPRTAGVHVTNILRKLGVTNRIQAAALAERAGLLGAR